jgi:hypothetical protein
MEDQLSVNASAIAELVELDLAGWIHVISLGISQKTKKNKFFHTKISFAANCQMCSSEATNAISYCVSLLVHRV